MKYLLLFALLAVVWWIWKKRSALPPPDNGARRDPAPERMVTCAHCRVHLPESDSIADGQEFFCSAAHRDAARAAKRG